MPAQAAKHAASLALVCGDDDFVVKQRARQIYLEWTAEVGGMDHETIDAGACAIAAYDQEELDELLGLDGEEEFSIYIASVGKVKK